MNNYRRFVRRYFRKIDYFLFIGFALTVGLFLRVDSNHLTESWTFGEFFFELLSFIPIYLIIVLIRGFMGRTPKYIKENRAKRDAQLLKTQEYIAANQAKRDQGKQSTFFSPDDANS